MSHACPSAARTRVGKKRGFYEWEHDPTWRDELERQCGRRREGAKGLRRSTARWLCPVPVSDSVSLGYRELERKANSCSMNSFADS